MYLYLLFNLIGIGLLVASWKYTSSIFSRISTCLLSIIYIISYNVIFWDNLYISNFKISNQIVENIQLRNYNQARDNITKLKPNYDRFSHLYAKNNNINLLLNGIIDLSTNKQNINALDKYLKYNVNSNVIYSEFKFVEKILQVIEIEETIKHTPQNITHSFYVEKKIHGFYNDVAYLQIINHYLKYDKTTEAIELIRQLLNRTSSRLHQNTIKLLEQILINLIT